MNASKKYLKKDWMGVMLIKNLIDLFNNVDKDILPLWARKNRRRMLKMSFLNGCMG
jgi:hypothetical protein